MDGNCVSNVGCGRPWNIGKRLLVQRNFELANTVDTIKEAEKMDLYTLAAESLLELHHKGLVFSGFFRLGVISSELLELSECVPRELDHFFISLR